MSALRTCVWQLILLKKTCCENRNNINVFTTSESVPWSIDMNKMIHFVCIFPIYWITLKCSNRGCKSGNNLNVDSSCCSCYTLWLLFLKYMYTLINRHTYTCKITDYVKHYKASEHVFYQPGETTISYHICIIDNHANYHGKCKISFNWEYLTYWYLIQSYCSTSDEIHIYLSWRNRRLCNDYYKDKNKQTMGEK